MPTSSAYNPNGRGYPDVSALGDLYPIVLNGELLPVDGTSASTPFFAGVLSLLHDVAHANGDVLPSYINPVLYESVSSFHDIVEGNNECGRASSEGTCGGCQCENGAGGWYALSGWDPVTGTFFLLCEYYYTRRLHTNHTGLGTLNFTAFRVSKGLDATEYSENDDTDYTMLVVGLIAGSAVLFSVIMMWWWKRRRSSDIGDGDDYDAEYVPMDDDNAVVIQ